MSRPIAVTPEHGRNIVPCLQRPHLLLNPIVRRFCPTVLAVRTAKLSLRSSNNAYFLPLIYLCPGKKIQVMSAVPGIELLGPYRRIYDRTAIQRITIDCGPENVQL
jgi:hypothetical protein